MAVTLTDLKRLGEKKKLLKSDIISLYGFIQTMLTTWGDTTAHINYVQHLKETFKRRELTRPQTVELLNIVYVGLVAKGTATAANLAELQNIIYAGGIFGLKRQILIDFFDVLEKEL